MKLLFKSMFIPVVLISVLLSACGGSSNEEFDKDPDYLLPHGPIFDIAAGKIPTTNDLFFIDSEDGTLNIPNKEDESGNINPIIAQVNQLDGFSTSIPITAKFGIDLDPASLIIGDTIHVFQVTKNLQGAVTSVVREVTAAEMIAVPSNGTTLVLFPRLPLLESTSYLVVLTNGIKAIDGSPAKVPAAYSLIRGTADLTGNYAALAPLRPLFQNMEAMADTQASVDKDDIILTWSFTTQSTTAVLNAVAASAAAGAITTAPMQVGGTTLTTAIFQPRDPVSGAILIDYNGRAFTGKADVHIGTLDVPYYLEVPSAANPIAPLTGYWKGVGGSSLTRYNTNPVMNTTLKIPLIMSVPNAASGKVKPAAGWPVIIYQHGITRVRTDMLVYADEMAKAGFAVIAIDLPLHGVTDTTNPFHASNTPFAETEASFDVDYINNTTSAPGPDGVIDDSGSHYINLASLLTSRDNTRQGVSNLLVLKRSLKDIPNIDENSVGFIAHSLGGIVGVTYLAVEDQVMPSSLVTTGASISTILRDSVSYGPIIRGGLAAQGVTGADYEAFLMGAQWILDSSDPINFAQDAAITHPIHMIEIVGDGGTHVADTTVPNSSTEILAALIGAQQASVANNPVEVGAPKIVRFIQGDHSSVLDPTDDAPVGTTYLNVFEEIHSQLSSFQTSGGITFSITNTGIVAP